MILWREIHHNPMALLERGATAMVMVEASRRIIGHGRGSSYI